MRVLLLKNGEIQSQSSGTAIHASRAARTVGISFFGSQNSELEDCGIYSTGNVTDDDGDQLNKNISDDELVDKFVDDEMERYSETAKLHAKYIRDPRALLQFWSKFKTVYPVHFIDHRRVSGCSHSMGLEQDFSTFSWIYSPLRTRLRPQVIEMMCYLVINEDVIEWNNVPPLTKEEAKLLEPKTLPRNIQNFFAGGIQEPSDFSVVDEDSSIDVEEYQYRNESDDDDDCVTMCG